MKGQLKTTERELGGKSSLIKRMGMIARKTMILDWMTVKTKMEVTLEVRQTEKAMKTTKRSHQPSGVVKYDGFLEVR